MKGSGVLVAAFISMGAHGQCIEEDLVVQHCLTPAEAAYTCQNTGSTDIGLEQVLMCLDSWINQSGYIETLDRAGCIGEQVMSERSAENVSRCGSAAKRR